MKCNGNYDYAGKCCDMCSRFQDDCEGHPDYFMDDNGIWRENTCTGTIGKSGPECDKCSRHDVDCDGMGEFVVDL